MQMLREARIRLSMFAAGVILSAVLLAGQAPSYSHAVLAAVTILLGTIPIILFFTKVNKSAIPIFEVSCLYYAIFYGLVVFLSDWFWPDTHPVEMYGYQFQDKSAAISIAAQVLVLAGLVSYIMAFYLFRQYTARTLPSIRIVSGSPGSQAIAAMAWTATAVILIYHFVPGVRSLPSIGQLAQPMGYFAFAIFIFGIASKTTRKLHCMLALGIVFPIIITKLLASGSIMGVLWFALIGGFAAILVYRRVPWKTGIVMLLFAYFSYEAMSVYRTIVWGKVNPDCPSINYFLADGRFITTWGKDNPSCPSSFSPTDRVATVQEKSKLFTGLLLYSVTGWKVDYIPDALLNYTLHSYYADQDRRKRVSARLNQISLLSGLMEQTPAVIPYWKGETYAPLLGSMIPRVVWPGKPREMAGGKFGNLYWGTEKSTSVNIPWLVELYGNYGWTGIFLGMAFFGLILAFLDYFLNSRDGSRIQILTGLTVLSPWCFPESNFSVMVGSTPLLLITMTIFVMLFTRMSMLIGSSRPRNGDGKHR